MPDNLSSVLLEIAARAVKTRRDLHRFYFRFSSFANSDRKSASARFPANWAAISDWNPSPVILIPNGLLLRNISQLQRSGYSPRRDVTT
jgi:hypothetical protein